MEDYKLALAALTKRVNQLIAIHQSSEKHVNQLVQERDELTQQLEALTKTNHQLVQENKALKIANSVPTEQEDRVELKKRVNELVKEVDECISMLNK